MSWLRRLFASKRMDQEFDSELRFHLEQQIADKVRAGMTEDEARRSTRLEFGGLAQMGRLPRKSRHFVGRFRPSGSPLWPAPVTQVSRLCDHGDFANNSTFPFWFGVIVDMRADGIAA